MEDRPWRSCRFAGTPMAGRKQLFMTSRVHVKYVNNAKADRDTSSRRTMATRNFSFPFLRTCFLGVGLVCSGVAAWGQENWPQFRGPGSLGVGHNQNLPTTWSTNQNVAWKTAVPGMGW